jgi:hypothetical protein
VVHEAARPVTLERLRENTARAVPALFCCVALLAGCGSNGEEGSSEQQADELPQPVLPVPMRQAECSDWRKGSAEQRRGTVVQIREFAGGPVGSSQGIQRGRVLDDAQAYQLIDRYCSRPIARGFRLYLLYERAAAFVGQQGNARPFRRPPASENPRGY